MKIVKPKVEILTELNGAKILKHIEKCGRVCYKSEDRITEESAEKFVRNLLNRNHLSVLEHYSFTVKFTCDRGISHEIVRHRIASYSQESSRYCNYSKDKFGSEITVVLPFADKTDLDIVTSWVKSCEQDERRYFQLLEAGEKPEIARAVLPTCLKTELVMTANIREWLHFLDIRCDKAAHPQVRKLAEDLLIQLHKEIPVIFDNLYNKYVDNVDK